MKVYELSKELGIESKEVIELANSLEINIKSHLSVIQDEDVKKIKHEINKENEESINLAQENIIDKKEIKNEEVEIEEKTEEEIKQDTPKQDTPKQSTTIQDKVKKWKPDLTRMICVKNIARGKLIYISKRQAGYTVEWSSPGDENYLEMSEFISLKNSSRRFLTEPWIRIVEDDEIELLKYFNIFQYYKDILGINNVMDILQLSFDDFKNKFDKLPQGYKNSVMEQASKMIKDGTLDSIKIKNYIEKKMNVDLNILIKSDSKNQDFTIK